MYESHSAFVEPGDGDRLWRYIDFTKFVAMLDERALYFQRITNLDDPYEGTITKPTAERMRAAPPGLTDEQVAQRRKVAEYNIQFMDKMRSIFSVSCWHISNIESDTMWGRYLGGADGVAVVSTFGRFKAALLGSSHTVHGCRVEYIDYETTEVNAVQSFNWVKHKRLEFAHDHEFRGVVMSAGLVTVGETVTVDLNELIEHIYVAPHCADWVGNLVARLTAQHGIVAPVARSGLSRGPDYLKHRRR